jgi:hypothetical protein
VARTDARDSAVPKAKRQIPPRWSEFPARNGKIPCSWLPGIHQQHFVYWDKTVKIVPMDSVGE